MGPRGDVAPASRRRGHGVGNVLAAARTVTPRVRSGRSAVKASTRARKQRIFVVAGTAGQYADRLNWNVLAFEDASVAEAFRVTCQQAADRLFAAWQRAIAAAADDESQVAFPRLGRHRHDPFFSNLTDRAVYAVETLSLRCAPRAGRGART
jgi:hypothetical protein